MRLRPSRNFEICLFYSPQVFFGVGCGGFTKRRELGPSAGMFTNLKGAWKGAFAEGPLPDQQKENDRAAGGAEAGGAAEGQKGNWLARAANKVSSAASTITTRTASLLDFHSGEQASQTDGQTG